MKAKIGIRPTIDGRWGGVREGLEAQTMKMALNAKQLIEDNCFYSDGTPVEVVIAPSTIGGGYEAAKAAEMFSTMGVTATLTVTPCWCYGSETMDIDSKTIKAVWGFNGTERPGAVYLAAVMAAHAQKGLPAFAIYGRDVQDQNDTNIPEDVKEKILKFAQCAIAAGQMLNKAYVGLGSVSMGIAGSYVDDAILHDYFGIRAEWVDMSEINRRITLGIYDSDELIKQQLFRKSSCFEGQDRNATPCDREDKDGQWAFVEKMTLVMKDIMVGNPKLAEMGYYEESMGRNAIAGGFQGQRAWTDWLPNGDYSETMLNSSFDWNGKKEPLIVATENDYCNGMSMLFLKLITGQAAAFADVRTYWSPDAVKRVTGWQPTGYAQNGFIHLINSGSACMDATGLSKNEQGKGCMKKWWNVDKKDIDSMTAATKWSPASLGYFRGGGYSSTFKTEAEMPVTMARLNIVKGIGPVLQIAEGYTVLLPDKAHKNLLERTDPTWPSTWFAPIVTGEGAFKDVYSVMANWGANHGAFTYGHVGAELITLASMLRIPVNMHNVESGKIFRPHAWAAFGTEAKESADFRACQTYGPLYK